MGERKVVNKYYPAADFDPAKIPRRRQGINKPMKVTMMLPMSMKCGTCDNYLYRATKFNSRKEEVVGQRYRGIQILRFYINCSNCSAEITFRTNPRNSDYTVESGASRINFEPQDEEIDPMKRSLDSKRQIKSNKSIHETLTLDSLLEALQRLKQLKQEDEDLDETLNRRIADHDMDNLHQIKSIKSKSSHETLTLDSLLEAQQRLKLLKEEEEEE